MMKTFKIENQVNLSFLSKPSWSKGSSSWFIDFSESELWNDIYPQEEFPLVKSLRPKYLSNTY